MASNDSTKKTLLVAVALCIVCSLVVSAAVVLLKPDQIKNKALDRKTNILAAAGMLNPDASKAEIEAEYAEKVTAKVVNLETGRFAEEIAADGFDQKKVAKDVDKSIVLSDADDVAKISRRENFGIVYLVKHDGELDKIILPVRGYGLWSTLYGFLALESDLNTVAGLGFYEHGETPGLGGEVDNPNWKALWPGKQVYSGGLGGWVADASQKVDRSSGATMSKVSGEVAIRLIKGKVDHNAEGAEYRVDGLSGATLTSKGVTNLLHFWMGEMGYKKFLANLKSGEA